MVEITAVGIALEQGLSLDIDLIATRPELVISHLRARRADEEQIQSVDRIGGVVERRCLLLLLVSR